MSMAGQSAAKTRRRQDKDSQHELLFDRELEDLPSELRWREWMLRVEAVIFASAEPMARETLARVVGKDCNIDLLIDDLREELRDRPYELVSVAGGWQHWTRVRFSETIRVSSAPTRGGAASSKKPARNAIFYDPRAALSFGMRLTHPFYGAIDLCSFRGIRPVRKTGNLREQKQLVEIVAVAGNRRAQAHPVGQKQR